MNDSKAAGAAAFGWSLLVRGVACVPCIGGKWGQRAAVMMLSAPCRLAPACRESGGQDRGHVQRAQQPNSRLRPRGGPGRVRRRSGLTHERGPGVPGGGVRIAVRAASGERWSAAVRCGRCTWAYVSRRARWGRAVHPRVDAVPPSPRPPTCPACAIPALPLLAVRFALSGRAALRCARGDAEGCGAKLARGKGGSMSAAGVSVVLSSDPTPSFVLSSPRSTRRVEATGAEPRVSSAGRHDSVGASWDGRYP